MLTVSENFKRDLVRRLIYWKLAGEDRSIEMVKLYFIDDLPPSDILRAMKIKRRGRHTVVRIHSKIQRIQGPLRHKQVREILTKIYPELMKIKPIVYSGYCVVCKKKVNSCGAIHIKSKKHKEIVDMLMRRMDEVLQTNLDISQKGN